MPPLRRLVGRTVYMQVLGRFSRPSSFLCLPSCQNQAVGVLEQHSAAFTPASSALLLEALLLPHPGLFCPYGYLRFGSRCSYSS